MLKYHHIGIPTSTPQPGEQYLESLKIYCTDHQSNPYGIQWMRYGNDCPLPGIVQTKAHVAFQVEDLAAAIKDQKVIIKPNSPSEGVMVAFIEVNGAPVELLEFKKKF